MNLEELYRREYGRILASLIRTVRDFTLAEDSLQDAFAAAHVQWPERGVPPNPVAWLMTTARNKAIDHIRHRSMAEHKHTEMITLATPEENAPVPLDSLRLIFTCCHPAIAPEAQVALTLHTVCGLATEEIARAFLVPVPTLAQRLVRAKAKIRVARIPYEVPDEDQLAERLNAVLAVIYLVFNEGYSASSGSEMIRADLCTEAIRLGRELVSLMPNESEPRGLLALMLLNDARRQTRTNAQGDIVLLEEQNRSQWDQAKISEGTKLVDAVARSGRVGIYVIQAAIASLHSRAPSAAQTDWAQIASLYALLLQLNPSPVIELNRAVAIAMSEGFEKGLALLEGMELPGYHLLPAAKADLLRRLNRPTEAAAAYREALSLVKTDAERRFLTRRLADVTQRTASE